MPRAHLRRENARGFVAEDARDLGLESGRTTARHIGAVGMIGRTSIEPMRAPGMRSAMPIASSRSFASTR